MPTAERTLLQVRIDRDAADSLRRFSEEHGVSTTALVQAFAERAGNDAGWLPSDIITRARQVDAERRARRS